MRIWDLPVEELCDKHLIAEHGELHAIWSILKNQKKGYSNHPEIVRWKGRLDLLAMRHFQQVQEMRKRCFKHESELSDNPFIGQIMISNPKKLLTLEKQRALLIKKGCGCQEKWKETKDEK